jgi:hypothetical protein
MHSLWRLSCRQRWVFFPIAMFIALAVMLCGLCIRQTPRVHAAGSGPVISWDKSMIYPGENNGDPWGPVGENAIIHGQNFSANLSLSVVLVQGNSNQNPALCSKAPVATIGSVSTGGAGMFQLNFTWPGQAGVINGEYSVCSLSNGLPISYRDGGPFTVLASSAPSVAVSPNSVQPGGSITISGQNWVPPQQVNITVTGSSQLLSATPTSSGLNTGTFSLNVNIPSNASPGGYVVSGFTGNNVLHAPNQNISITVPATPTPTATPSPTPTATAKATVTTTATVGGTSTAGPGNTPTSTSANSGSNNSGSTGGGGGPSPLVLIVFIAIALVLLTSIGLIIFMVLHRAPPQNKRPTRGGAPAPHGPYNGSAANSSYPASPNAAPYDGFVAAGWQPQPPANTSGIFSQATQFTPGYSQPGAGMSAPNNPAFAPASPLPPSTSPMPGMNAPICPNCGRLLLPNAVRCDNCGMPANIPGW